MIAYHVVSITKFLKCIKQGFLPAPVRAWETIEEAERFSKQTGRAMILRLKFPEDTPKLEGHKNKARILHQNYPTANIFNGYKHHSMVKGQKA